MHAVILAAGVGTRLGRPFPKSLSMLPTGERILGRGDDPLFPVRETIRKVLFNPAAEFPSAKILAFLRQSVSA